MPLSVSRNQRKDKTLPSASAANASRCKAGFQRQPDRAVDSDFVLETIVTRMSYENYERVFQTFVRWARFGELFAYDETTQRLTLIE